MNPRYHVETTYDGPAYAALTAVTWELFNSRNYRRFLAPCILIIAVAGAAVLTFLQVGKFVFWFAILAVLMTLASPLAMQAQKRRITQQSIEKARAFPMEVAFDFEERAFRVTDPFGEQKKFYHDVERIVDGGPYIFLMMGTTAYLLQTRKNFQDQQERTAFCRFLHEKCGQAEWRDIYVGKKKRRGRK